MNYVYGIHAVDSLLRQRAAAIVCLYLQSGRNDKRLTGLETLAANQGVKLTRCAKEQLDGMVAGRHQGAVAQLNEEAPVEGLSEAAFLQTLEGRDGILLLVLDGVTDPHNLGACLRSADAAGVDAVIVPKDNSADLTPVARKVACGAAETVPLIRVTNLARTLKALQATGVWIYGTAGEAEQTLYDSDLRTSAALVLGAEGKGLRRLTREQCDVLVSLPMAGSVSSLNVSVAAGVCLFEAVRQRSA